MLRQNLSGRGGRWFDLERAQKFEEDSYFDGENFRSRATGGLWSHETLYRSANGRWILRKWSRVDGVTDRWIEIDAAAAADWLARNNYDEELAELQMA